jgi:acyl-CoA synthetase (AMP-forming)/AMP-acid ligase II
MPLGYPPTQIQQADPGVTKPAIVFGVPDPEWGVSVVSAIVLREEFAGIGAEALIAFCRSHLASFKKPRRIEFVAELPKTAYGKVLRRDLRDRFNRPR